MGLQLGGYLQEGQGGQGVMPPEKDRHPEDRQEGLERGQGQGCGLREPVHRGHVQHQPGDPGFELEDDPEDDEDRWN